MHRSRGGSAPFSLARDEMRRRRPHENSLRRRADMILRCCEPLELAFLSLAHGTPPQETTGPIRQVLSELEFTYDSSIFPIQHDIYGIPVAPRFPCRGG